MSHDLNAADVSNFLKANDSVCAMITSDNANRDTLDINTIEVELPGETDLLSAPANLYAPA